MHAGSPVSEQQRLKGDLLKEWNWKAAEHSCSRLFVNVKLPEQNISA